MSHQKPRTALGHLGHASTRTAHYLAGAVLSSPASLASLGAGARDAAYAAGNLTLAGVHASTGIAMVHAAALAQAAADKAKLIGLSSDPRPEPPKGALGRAKSMAGFGARMAIEAYPLLSALASFAQSKTPTMTPLDSAALNSTELSWPHALSLSAHHHAGQAQEAMIDFRKWRQPRAEPAGEPRAARPPGKP